ncbi:hypothetical protein EDC27_1780 [Desulfosoma caldarium]|uniref:Uncharacterized protein n=1 Tax=Desulfosoma caldarium TaxID=610254 RepID=A0A3N1UTQ3_9BACT|nr:hypothetical protein EDC27_1780 [Desulfosoma caldarium]
MTASLSLEKPQVAIDFVALPFQYLAARQMADFSVDRIEFTAPFEDRIDTLPLIPPPGHTRKG